MFYLFPTVPSEEHSAQCNRTSVSPPPRRTRNSKDINTQIKATSTANIPI